ncbi:hypothetical protein IE53DRAFT_375259 [Violaceomyces palustris]|uniref:Uncharacterized protein n=1 Tax=Violaceomyces palustris TaxID=1673888 RepID=A0ACD0NTM0_9BASI|nr:hypothetical protein IE53DRAFT_375259 [Violaceomyces palustris]
MTPTLRNTVSLTSHHSNLLQIPSATKDDPTDVTTALSDPTPSRMADPPSNLPHPQQQQQPPPPVFGLGQNVVRGPGQLSDESISKPSHEAAEVGGPVNAQSDSSSAQGDQQGSPSSRAPPVTLYFRLPFNGPDGNPALLAFTPTVVPNPAARSGGEPLQEQEQRQQDGDTDQQRDQEGGVGGDTQGNGRQPNASPNAQGHVPIAPIFVPLGASPLPFSFIYDASTNLAWPIAEVRVTPPPNSGGDTATFVATATGAAQSTSRLVAGPPFRIALDLHFGQPPEPEQPDPERAARFVSGLEKADSELRSRMARLGMGDIGDYEGGGGHTTSEGQDHALLGCGICLERYEEEDRPEWIAGKASEDEAVVAVPCSGHHTLHAGCLRDWLAKTPPSQWSCPFCRAPLCKKRVEESASSSNGPEGQSFSSSPSSSTGKNCQEGKDEDAKVTTLREEVRHRERLRGWRCDAPACLPRYPPSGKEEKEESERECHSTSSCWEDGNSTRLVKLTPCKHEVHLDCLCTSMRVEADLLTPQEMEEEREDGGGGLGVEGIWNQNLDCFEARSDDEGEGGEDDQDPTNHSLRVSGSEKIADEDGDEICTVGKWVTCPTCRKESWANLPVRKRPRRRREEEEEEEEIPSYANRILEAKQEVKEMTLGSLPTSSRERTDPIHPFLPRPRTV